MSEGHLERDTVALLTPVASGEVVAAVCALNGVRGRVLETSAGAFTVLEDASEGAADAAAEVVSAFVKEQPILALERRSGQIAVRRWLAGRRGDALPPGLALDQAPGVVVSIMSGSQTIDEIAATHPDKVADATMGRVKAFRVLRALAKDAKRRAREHG